MEALDQISTTVALSMGLAWASGINLYATILMLGLLSNTGNLDLPPELTVVQNPLIIGAAGLMYFVEFFADKVPGVDTAWDAVHTFIRIPAGAMLAAGSVGTLDPSVEIAAAILGGGMAAGSHAVKAGSRVLINASPEPFSNWTASVSEDVLVVSGIWAAINNPELFLALLLVFIVLMIWLLPKIWRGLKKLFRMIANFFGAKNTDEKRIEPPS